MDTNLGKLYWKFQAFVECEELCLLASYLQLVLLYRVSSCYTLQARWQQADTSLNKRVKKHMVL